METPTQNKKITIFTTFSDNSEAYSLNRVVKDQIKMLLNGGYQVAVVVAEPFDAGTTIYADPRVELKRIPLVPVHNEVKKDETFDEDVTKIETALNEVLSDGDIVITHDVIYQNAALKHNFAARRVAEKKPQIKWLHWIHSATSPVTLANLRSYFADEYLNLIAKPFPNSFYVFFNHYSIPRIAENFNIPREIVKVVHHPSDLADVYALSPQVEKVARSHNMYAADAICVYPIRLDRGKQVQYVIRTMGALKNNFDLSVRVVIADFHSTGGDKLTYRDELKGVAIDAGLNNEDLIWTSEEFEEWKGEVPHADLLGFMRLSNVFIMPSVSESYSLVTQEAGLNGAVTILNFDFPPFRDIFGPNAIYRKYSSNLDMMNGMDGHTNTEYGPNNASPEERKSHEQRYHIETAGLIHAQLKSSDAIQLKTFLRKFRNLDYIFKHELEPLFYAKANQ